MSHLETAHRYREALQRLHDEQTCPKKEPTAFFEFRMLARVAHTLLDSLRSKLPALG